MDIFLKETGTGGDIEILGNDVKTVNGIQNMPYLGMFGGNIEENTKEYTDGELRHDWFGNSLLMDQNSRVQMNSDVERFLNENALNSESRIRLEKTIKSDLSFMDEYAEFLISANIISVDRISILIKIKRPDSLESKEYLYIWDSTKNELING